MSIWYDEERDYDEEAYNAALMHDEAEHADHEAQHAEELQEAYEAEAALQRDEEAQRALEIDCDRREELARLRGEEY